ncbi:MAG TPA: DUF2064 domain-containing protein [Thermoanaerobaculia bacterium]
MSRYLVLFAREPAREAREKGFGSSDAVRLFASFASGWARQARRVGATLVIAAPREDRTAWSRRLRGEGPLRWISQNGASFGQRVERTARAAALLRGHAILVGGDVPPCGSILARAFEALETGAQAVIAPAEDGGISLVGLEDPDLDLLGVLAPRRRNVFANLYAALRRRGRTVELLETTPDVDGRRDLRSLVRREGLEPDALELARRCLAAPRVEEPEENLPLRAPGNPPADSRAPPRAA